MRICRVPGLRIALLLSLLVTAACTPTLEKPAMEPQSKKSSGKRGTSRPYEVFGKTYYPLTEEEAAGYVEEGVASWYGKEFHDRPTANGERFDMYKVSAAHTVLPLPILVRVTNLDNGRSLDVRVNDRGPFIDNRLIDLSFAGAEQLGFSRHGTAKVRVQAMNMLAKADPGEMRPPATPGAKSLPPLPPPRPEPPLKDTPWRDARPVAGSPVSPDGKEHYIQVGSFGQYENAQEMERRQG
ncbi:MAG: septal ring lytic transglycosylase RlpA family protein, partial [Magnetococcales bacterium]|nr:septal ring lytic transglycosylase RlpA family protein [Magnetococcales bacterium]